MFKRLLSLVLILLILSPTLGKSWILISFRLNQESIAKNLCVLRKVKNNSCHGCCQLKKRLAEKEKQEQKQLPKGSTEKNNLSPDYFFKKTDYSFYLSSSLTGPYKNIDCSLPNRSPKALFHPPQA